MTALVGTVTQVGLSGEKGNEYSALLTYALTGALVNGDTITWSNVLPSIKQCNVIWMDFQAPELDTNATPTMTFTIGDGTTANAYLTTKGGAVGLQNSLGGQLAYYGDGAGIGAAPATRNLVFTVTAAVATGATTGTISILLRLKGI